MTHTEHQKTGAEASVAYAPAHGHYHQNTQHTAGQHQGVGDALRRPLDLFAPGAHQLDVRFQFEVAGGGGGDEFNGEPLQMTCHLRFAYDGFAAGQRYRIEARPLQYKAQGWLYGADRQVLARAKVLRCNTFG